MMRKVCANTGKILTDTPKKSAQGYVVFETVESVDEALRMNNTTYQTHTIRVDRADPTVEPSRSVFVGNLPYGADEETLRDHFSGILNDGEDLNEREGGAISGVRIIRDKETQKCKGFGYVTLRDATLVANALQAHGTTYMKRELRVMICGKRFKGNRGDDSAGDKSARRSFDGKGAKGSSPTKNQSSKRKFDDGAPLINGGAMKRIKRRARSEKKTVISGTKSGLSKRAAAVQKVNKRVKKLQNRVVKGMGKKKH
jgi:nucleolar protein 12